MRSNFTGPGATEHFRDEQARWFLKYDGRELRGGRREQNKEFDRLRDMLSRYRRSRANPSGTRRRKRADD